MFESDVVLGKVLYRCYKLLDENVFSQIDKK